MATATKRSTCGAAERAWFGGGTLPEKPVLDGEAPLEREPLVERLLAVGWEVAAEGEGAASSRRLEAELGSQVANFSFPAGTDDEADVAAVEAAGHAGATVTGAGFATSSKPYAMPRITVSGLAGVDGSAEAVRSRDEGVGA
jgi:hypothetical protein